MPTRSFLLGCALLSGVAFGACSTKELHPADARPKGWTGSFAPAPGRKVDMLFVIDDSPGMALAQNNLIRNFPALMTALQADPAGLPDLHIAVLSSDMGAHESTPGCSATGGANGIFQYTARGTCGATNLEAGATFISNGGGVTNYAGNIEDVFGCIAALGESGCRFTQPFAALGRALGPYGTMPAENQDFLRWDAVLAIVMLTNQDDCSSGIGPIFYEGTSNANLGSQLGPQTAFRCNEFGHRCVGGGLAHPDRYAPNDDVNAMVSYGGCESNDVEGYLVSTAETATRIRSFLPDPARVMVASIQGSPAPYIVHWTNPPSTDGSCPSGACPWPAITHSCTAADGRFGDPGVRTAQLARQFGANGLVLSVCDGSFGPSLTAVGTVINRMLGPPPCIPGPIALDSAGEPDCSVTTTISSGVGGDGVTNRLASCAMNGGAPPCWRLESAASCSGQVLKVSADPNLPASTWVTVSYDCAK